MTRDDLISQAAHIASGRRSGKRGLVHWQRIVARLVDADWRPVSDDDATVDKVARAIRADLAAGVDRWDELPESVKDQYRPQARRAVEALRGDSDA